MTPAAADGGSIAAKQAQAQSVLGQVQQLDSSVERAVEAYDLATTKLAHVRANLKQNHAELQVAKQSLRRAQSALASRVVSLYTQGGNENSLEVLLGASNLDDLVNRFNAVNRISAQDSQVLGQVKTFNHQVKTREARLKKAKQQADALVRERAAVKASVESQLASRKALLSSIRGQIVTLQRQEAARQVQLRHELAQRMAAQQATPAQAITNTVAPVASAPSTPSTPSSPPSSPPVSTAPPATHSSVVAVAERYLGVPYRWGGASPSGFDCSGLVMYAFSQIGVSLPHSSYAQYGMGSPVARSELQPGDLVFFDGLGHVGIYVGGNSFIHAPHTGDVVKISSISGWYASTYVGARRI